VRIALIDSTPKGKIYPLPLLKIGAWRKAEGDDCQIYNDRLPKGGEFDEIWITTTFTFNIPHALGIVKEAVNRAGRVWVGGISATLLPERFEKLGVDVHRGLLPDAEKFSPDYSLLGVDPEYSISHTSRGCVRKCGFCMVRKLEPKFKNRKGWENDIHPGTNKVLFFDNNWIAKKRVDLEHDIDILKGLVSSGKVKHIDFNQGLDARLMTEEIADLLRGLPISPVRFAFDGMQEDGFYQRAVRMMAERGFRTFCSYVLYNFDDSPQDFYYRLRESVILTDDLHIECKSFPMRFQPILETDSQRFHVGDKWTLQKRNAVNNIVSKHSIDGQISCTGGLEGGGPIGEFEYWFGKDAEEFNRLLSYPKLRELMAKKKGALRTSRAKAS
jgi:hypothetical protein